MEKEVTVLFWKAASTSSDIQCTLCLHDTWRESQGILYTRRSLTYNVLLCYSQKVFYFPPSSKLIIISLAKKFQLFALPYS
jgi:hypothetical protein